MDTQENAGLPTAVPAPPPLRTPSAPSHGTNSGNVATVTAATESDAALPGDAGSNTPSAAIPAAKAPQSATALERAVKKKAIFDGIHEFVIGARDARPYAVLTNKGYPEPLAIGSTELNSRIRTLVRQKGRLVRQRELDELNEELRSEADAVGKRLDVFPRVHPTPNGIEVDLCDGRGTTVRIGPRTVEITRGTSPTLFIRSPSSAALPEPASQGDYATARKYFNLDEDAFLLYVAWLAFTIAHPKVDSTKYVFLVIKGTEGSGKTFASKATQKLVDPRSTGAQALPTNERDLAIAMQSVHMLLVDNMRDLSPAMSDTLCIVSTGGAIATRKLYTDDEQKALHLHGQIVFNGIHPFMGQSDFADRCLVLNLHPLDPEKRKFETDMLAQFEADRPVILRGLYDLIAEIFALLPSAVVTSPARMLDFCRWLAAAEVAMKLRPGALQAQYVESLRDAKLETLLDNPLAATLMNFADALESGEWVGTPADLYEKLESLASWTSQRSRAWPSSAAVMSKRLHGLQAPLRAVGIEIQLSRGKERMVSVVNHNPQQPKSARPPHPTREDGQSAY